MNAIIKPDEFIVGQGMSGGKGGSSGDSPKNSIRSNAIAEVLELISEGPIKGLVNGARSIYLNETPLKARNGKWNFKGVTWDFRRGSVDNENKPIKGNNRVETPVEVNAKVTKKNGPVIRTVTNPLVDAVRVIVRIPALYKYNKKNGKMEKTDLHYKIEVRRPAGAGPWTTVVDQKFTDEKTSSPYQKAHYFELPDGEGDCDIRFVRETDDSDTERLANETWWESYFEIIKGKFYYPHSAVLRLTMNAEKVGSQIPSRAVEVYGMIVKVPSNYDPETRTYDGIWDGTFKHAWTDNPAWIFYDLITDRRYGMGEFVKENQVDKWSLYTVARHCDQLVDTGYRRPNGTKIKEPRYTFNGVLQNREEAFTVLKQIAAAWRGMVYWSLGQIFATIDAPADPVAIITPANVVNGEFKYSGTSLKATHSVVLVKWNDPDDFYKPATEVVINDDLLKKYGWREKQLDLLGCTSRSMAHRYGRWVLDTEQYENETVEYVAGLDNLNVKPGDIIAIADPMKAQVRAGGRLAADATSAYAILDQPFKPLAGYTGGYKIMLTRPSGAVQTLPNGTTRTTLNGEIVTVAIDSFDDGDATNGYRRVNFKNPLTGELPRANSMFAITGDVQPRRYRVLSVREEAKHQFRVTALFHDPNKFARVEKNIELEPIQYTRHENHVEPPENLTVVERHYLDEKNKLRTDVHISWTPSQDPLVKDYRVIYLHPSRGRIQLPWTDTVNVDLEDVAPGDYIVKVIARSHTGLISDELTGEFTVEGPSKIPPPIVENLRLAEGDGNTWDGRSVEVVWENRFARTSDHGADDYTHTDDFSPLYKFTRVRVIDANSGDILRTFRTKKENYTYSFRNNKRDNAKHGRSTPSRNLRFEVSITDQLGRESAVKSITVNNTAPPAPGFTIKQRGTTMKVNIEKVDADDIDGYMVWMSQSPGFTPNSSTLVYDGNSRHPSIDVKRGKDYYVICAAYDTFGKGSLNYSAQVHTKAGKTISDDQAPDQPTGLRVVSNNAVKDNQGHWRTKIVFDWDDNTDGITDHYEVEIEEDGDSENVTKRSKSRITVKTKPKTIVRIRVRACDGLGNKSEFTSWLQVTAAKKNNKPSKPVKVALKNGNRRVRAKWKKNTDEDHKRTAVWVKSANVMPDPETEEPTDYADGTVYDAVIEPGEQKYIFIAHEDTAGNLSDVLAFDEVGLSEKLTDEDVELPQFRDEIETLVNTEIEAMNSTYSALIADINRELQDIAAQVGTGVGGGAIAEQAQKIRHLSDRLRNLGAQAAFQGAVSYTERKEIIAQQDADRAAFTEEIQTVAAQNQTLAQRVTTFESNLNDLGSSLTTLESAFTNETSTLAAQIAMLNSSMEGKADASAVDAITTEINNVNGNITAVATALTELTAGTTPGDTATARFRMQATSAPSGYTARIGMEVRGGAGSSFQSAGLYLDVSNTTSRVVIDAGKFMVMTSSGALAPFSVSGNTVTMTNVYMQAAYITGTLTASQINAAGLNLSNANIGTLKVGSINIEDNAVTVQAGAETTGGASINGTGFTQMQSVSLSFGSAKALYVFMQFKAHEETELQLDLRSGGVSLSGYPKTVIPQPGSFTVAVDLFEGSQMPSGPLITFWLKRSTTGTQTINGRKLVVFAAKK